MATKRKQDTDSDGQSTKRAKHYLRKYNVTYLEYGFVPHTTDVSWPFCLVCNVVLSNEAMKSRLKAHLLEKTPRQGQLDNFSIPKNERKF